jgi:hypothetical protein
VLSTHNAALLLRSCLTLTGNVWEKRKQINCCTNLESYKPCVVTLNIIVGANSAASTSQVCAPSDNVTFVTNFVKIWAVIQKLKEGLHRQTDRHRQHGDFISVLFFLLRMEIGLKKSASEFGIKNAKSVTKWRVYTCDLLHSTKTLFPRSNVNSFFIEAVDGQIHYTWVYPKVSGLAAWSENCKWYISLPLGAVASLFCEPV